MQLPKENEKQNSLDVKPGAFRGSIDYTGVNETVHMNKYHFLLVVQRLLSKPKGPHLEHVAIPFGIFLAILLVMLTSSFKDSLGVKAEVWQSVAIIFAILSAGTTVFLFIKWCINKVKMKEQTPEDVLKDVLIQMEDQREKLASVETKSEPLKKNKS
jgi:hypothetical protein